MIKPNMHAGFGVADFSGYNYRWLRYILQVLMCLMLLCCRLGSSSSCGACTGSIPGTYS